MSAVSMAAALLAGALQGHALRRAALTGAGPFALLARLLLVGTVLLISALAGHILAAALAWLLGFSLTVLVVARRWV